MTLFYRILALVGGFWLGYGLAHADLATECDRLGGFYVGKRVFECQEVRDADH